MNCAQCNTSLAPGARFCGSCGYAAQGTAGATQAPGPSPGQGPAVDAMVGREIAGRYRLLTKLGEGGMGAVYRAEQISLKREVALKLLRPDLSSDKALVSRFDAEAKLVAKLRHPNTITLYDFGQDENGLLFIAMELLDGESLRKIMAQGPMPLPRALHVAEQIASSLADAHNHGIVHRDLKPDNVMLGQHGKKTDVVTVLDFGIAKLRDQAGNMTGMPVTQAGAILGTPQYMSPEQIHGTPVDGRTDVYSMGAMLYEMTTGRLPFESPTLMGMLSMHLNDAPVPPSVRRPELGLSPEIDRLVLTALAKELDQRPPSMERYGEMIAQCAAAIGGGRPVAAMGSQPSGQLGAARMSGAGPAVSGHGPTFHPQTGASPYPSQGASHSTGHGPGTGNHGMPSGYHTPAGPGGPEGLTSSTHTPAQIAGPSQPRSRLAVWLGLAAVVLAGAAVAIVLFTRGDPGDDSNQGEQVAALSSTPGSSSSEPSPSNSDDKDPGDDRADGDRDDAVGDEDDDDDDDDGDEALEDEVAELLRDLDDEAEGSAKPDRSDTGSGDEPNKDRSSRRAKDSKEAALADARKMMDRMLEAIAENQGDCDAMAQDLTRVIRRSRSLARRIEKLEENPETKAWLEAQGEILAAEYTPRLMMVMQAAQGCAGNRKLMRALEKLGELGS